MLDFPNAPTVGQKYPQPPVTGVPVYTWDGQKWTTVGGAVSGKTPIVSDGSVPMAAGLTLVAPPVNPTDAAAKSYVDARVRYDAPQTLTSDALPATVGQRTQARSNVYAAPFDAMAYNGMQFNGSMDVSQESGTNAVALAPATFKYIVDGFVGVNLGANRAGNAAQAAIGALAGYTNAIQLNCTTGAALAAADAQFIFHAVEGYRWNKLGFGASTAQPVTIGFWIISSVVGTMAVSVRNSANNRCYVVDVPITAASVWQYKTVTIPGCTDGAWLIGPNVGAYVGFCFGSGSTYQAAAANTWVTTTSSIATAATTNFWSAAGGMIYLTGVTILPGLEAPTAARAAFITRPFDQELMVCQRYYEKSFDYLTLPANGSTATDVLTHNGMTSVVSANDGYGSFIPFKVRKRAAPTFTRYGNNAGFWGYFPTPNGTPAWNTNSWNGSATETGVIGSQQVIASQYIVSFGHWVADARF
jgi:hypothetical protein